MFKALANILHRTPWWAMALIGVLSFFALVLFTIPFQVIRLEKAGSTEAENQAIKREVDAAFASQGLDVAEGFIRAFKKRSNDPVREAELENALEEIQRAREEIAEAGRVSAEARREAERAVKEAGQEAQRSAREAAREARQIARENLMVAAEAAVESARAALDGQRQALTALRESGVKDAQAEKSLNENIRKAEEALAKARKKLEAAKRDANSRGLRITLGSDKPALEIDFEDKPVADADKSAAVDTKTDPAKKAQSVPPAAPKAAQAPAAPKAAQPPAPPAPPKAPAPAATPRPPAEPATPATPAAAEKPALPSPPAAPAPPSPPSTPTLPREFRADIHEKVADDFFRLTFGAILIIVFIPLLLIAIIAKIFIDRARAAQQVAEEKKKEADIHSMNRQVVEARLMALQAQVEPHFLYNTLANVQALCEADPPLASKMVEHLIQYLRAALPKMRETSSTVGQEMELVRAYLNILKIRMGARLEFSINMPDDVAKLPFPPLMLPSLIENAIKHGLEPQREGGRIDITARRENGRVTIEVKDTGRGFGTGTSGGGVGLANIRERLAGLYGEDAALVMSENEPRGVIATLRVPDTPPREIGAAAAAMGASRFATPSAAPAAPTTLAGRVWGGVKTAHNIWARIAGYTFLVLMTLIAVGLVVALIGNLTGLMPLEFGDARIGGVQGAAIGTLITLVVFVVLAIVALVVVALVYGLGVMAAVLLVLIPLLILIGSFPALAPFVVVGGIVWWVMRKKKKEPELPTLKR